MKIKQFLGFTLIFTAVSTSLVTFADNVGTINTESITVKESNEDSVIALSNLHIGDTVTVLEEEEGWFKIAVDASQYAYIASQNVSLNKAEAEITQDDADIRTAPSPSAYIVKIFNKGQAVAVKGVTDEWCMIDVEGQDLFVKRNFVSGDMTKFVASIPPEKTQVENMYAVVNCSGGLNIRKEAASDSAVLTTLYNGTAVDVLEIVIGWVKIQLDDGTVGYASNEFVEIKEGEKPANQSADKAQQIIVYGKKYLGTPYVYGGTRLGSGVDCSGFVYAVFKDNGITLNRSSRDQVRNGATVNKADLQPGDLVFFNAGGSGGISHVGIYIGGGQYIHSSSGRSMGVIISNLNDDYSARSYVTAARVIQ